MCALVDRKWRGLGEIPRSELALRPEYAGFDAVTRFGLESITTPEPAECRAGDVLRASVAACERPLTSARVRQGPLIENLARANLHYGNVIVYLRGLGITPPSS